MKHISSTDILSSSQEIPQGQAALNAYIQKNILRLNTINPIIGGLIDLIGKNAKNAHKRVAASTPEEFRHYVMSLILLMIRTIEIAESREQTEKLYEPVLDPNILTQEILSRLGKSK